MTKSFSMAGWRCAFLLGNAEVVQALVKLKSYLDYGTFQPVQIAATVTLNEAPDFPERGLRDLRVAVATRCRRARAHRLGRPAAARIDVRVGADPEPYAEMDRSSSLALSATATSRCRRASDSGLAARASPASR